MARPYERAALTKEQAWAQHSANTEGLDEVDQENFYAGWEFALREAKWKEDKARYEYLSAMGPG